MNDQKYGVEFSRVGHEGVARDVQTIAAKTQGIVRTVRQLIRIRTSPSALTGACRADPSLLETRLLPTLSQSLSRSPILQPLTGAAPLPLSPDCSPAPSRSNARRCNPVVRVSALDLLGHPRPATAR